MFNPHRLVMIVIVAGVMYYAATNYGHVLPLKEVRENPLTKQASGSVLGILSPVASAGANLVSNLVVKKASEPLLKEYEKLQPEQKEIIKKQICK